MSLKYALSSFSSWLWTPSVMVVTENRRGGVFHGIIGHRSHFMSSLCCTCTVSHEAHPSLVWLAPVFPITCNSNHGLQWFKGISITISMPGLFNQATGLNMAMNSSPCPTPVQTYSWAIVSSGVRLLQQGLSDSHHPLDLYLLCHGFNHGPQTLRGQTCWSMDLSTSTDTLRYSGMACA